MGKLLLKIYQIVEDKGGLQGRFTLANKTGISRQQAEAIRDKASMVRQFKQVASEILRIEIEDLLK